MQTSVSTQIQKIEQKTLAFMHNTCINQLTKHIFLVLTQK